MCCSSKGCGASLAKFEIGFYILLSLIEIIITYTWNEIVIFIPLARGVIIPLLMLEIVGIQRQHYGIAVFSCVFRAFKLILAPTLLISLYIFLDSDDKKKE